MSKKEWFSNKNSPIQNKQKQDSTHSNNFFNQPGLLSKRITELTRRKTLTSTFLKQGSSPAGTFQSEDWQDSTHSNKKMEAMIGTIKKTI